MANNAKYTSAGKPKIGGAIFAAPLGSTLPTDAKTELDAAFKNLGYVTEDGMTNNMDRTSETIKSWEGDIVIVSQTESHDTFAFNLMEVLNIDTLKTVYGEGKVKGTDLKTGLTIEVSPEEAEARSWVIDLALKDGVIKRIVIPNGKISEYGEIVYKSDEAISYPVTVEGISDESGNTHYEYILDPNTTSGGE